MSPIHPPEYQQSPPQPPPLPAPPKRHRVRKALLITGSAFAALIALIVIISVATSGKTRPTATPTTPPPATSAPAVPTTPTAQSYPSTASLLAAMAAHGATCSGVSFISGGTIAGEVNPFAECSGTSDGDTGVTVFTDHASALAYANSMISPSVANSLGPTAEVVGPNWTVNTVPAFAAKVVSAVGGQLITAPERTVAAVPGDA
jgi:hypothetical protein